MRKLEAMPAPTEQTPIQAAHSLPQAAGTKSSGQWAAFTTTCIRREQNHTGRMHGLSHT